MTNYSKFATLIAIFAIVFSSCNKNESPEITIHELGYENTKMVKVGADLHIDAEILAPLKIASIQLIIHSEVAHAKAPSQKTKSSLIAVSEWKVDSIYTKGYAGVKNAEFHEDLDVPSSAVLGNYHVYIKVTDMEGNQTIKEDEIEVKPAK